MPSKPRSTIALADTSRPDAELDAAAAEAGGTPHHPLVVHVDGDRGVGTQPANSSPLAAATPAMLPSPSRCAGADVGDQADVGRGDLRQARDLAGRVHAHLEHRDRLVAGQAQQRQRQADEIVLVGVGLE